MHIIKSASILTEYLTNLRSSDKNVTVGFVPTMGALHEGHSSLIDESVRSNSITVCSIFVNPTQFGEENDLVTYPKPIENDIALLIKHKCDVLFLPSVEEVYPDQFEATVFDLDGIDFKIEGASRPGHFQGVCNVIARFLQIINPEIAYFGQKDFQQTVVVKKLVQILQSKTKIAVVPIKREPHGLAQSSRNVRLSKKGRQNAAFIYKAISQVKEDYKSLGLQESVAKAIQFINAQKGAKVDYLLAVDTTTLNEVTNVSDANEVAVLTVVEYEGVRLLDNIIL
ncbi:MAG: pantoate--beta-alanine ligase [Bacteroidia bacterium]|nr:pantoate--beta-alanine ligase [Bacteroidia bacterium]NNJ56049.1 pantoate--beta-alanine ligase [Bacteroidia bacterium]